MARRRASVATMSRPMGSGQDVIKAICLVLALNFRFYSLVFQRGYFFTLCTTNIMQHNNRLLFFLFLFLSIVYLYISRFVFRIGNHETAKFRFWTHDSQETVLQLRISEVGN